MSTQMFVGIVENSMIDLFMEMAHNVDPFIYGIAVGSLMTWGIMNFSEFSNTEVLDEDV